MDVGKEKLGRNEWKRDRVAGKCARIEIVRRDTDKQTDGSLLP